MAGEFQQLMSATNNPFSGRPFNQVNNPAIGFTGLDPKFIRDPRFDYIQKLTSHLPDNQPGYGILLGNPARDDFDSAPIAAHSQLAVDEPFRKLMSDMNQESIGPSPWFLQNIKEIQGRNPVITPDMVNQMRQRMLNTRDRIEDRY